MKMVRVNCGRRWGMVVKPMIKVKALEALRRTQRKPSAAQHRAGERAPHAPQGAHRSRFLLGWGSVAVGGSIACLALTVALGAGLLVVLMAVALLGGSLAALIRDIDEHKRSQIALPTARPPGGELYTSSTGAARSPRFRQAGTHRGLRQLRRPRGCAAHANRNRPLSFRREFDYDLMTFPCPDEYVGDAHGLRRHYADIISRNGNFGSDIEVLALALRHGVDMRVWHEDEAGAAHLNFVQGDHVTCSERPRVDVVRDSSGLHYQLFKPPAGQSAARRIASASTFFVDVPGDGNCLFHAISQGLREAGVENAAALNHVRLRSDAARFIRHNGYKSVRHDFNEHLQVMVTAWYEGYKAELRDCARQPRAA